MASGVVRHISPSVGEIGEHPATGSFRTKDGAGSALLNKKEKKRKEKKKNRKRENEREREKGSESELADSTWTEAELYVCLQTITLHANRYHPAA